MPADVDPALDTLLLPFANGDLIWPVHGGALFLRARDGWPLHRQPLPGLICEQPFKPDVDALLGSGLRVNDAPSESRYPLVLVLPPRQREEARALFVEAIARAAPGGIVIACMPNSEGAKSGEADLARLAGPLHSISKHHCRVFWTSPLDGAIDPSSAISAMAVSARAAAGVAADAPRPVADGRFVSRPGVFAWNRIDAASALLAAQLPTDLAGHGADLGAGYGYLAAEVLTRCPAVTTLDVYEADARALALARTNLAAFAQRALLGFHWHDVVAGLLTQGLLTQDLSAQGLQVGYDFIVSNPPFHAQGRTDRPELGRAFIAAAADALQPRGRLLLVANRHLPYEAILAARFDTVRTLAQQAGFKVIEARR